MVAVTFPFLAICLSALFARRDECDRNPRQVESKDCFLNSSPKLNCSGQASCLPFW
jgi:hypothetical protein